MIKRKGSTIQQAAYARRIFSGDGISKRQIALDVGYGLSAAGDPHRAIEKTKGYNNAMARLAADAGNLALCAIAEFNARGFKEFSNSEMTRALTAISNAWSKFNAPLNGKDPYNPTEKQQSTNKLRTIIHQRIEHQVINTNEETKMESPFDVAFPVRYAEVKEEPEKKIFEEELERRKKENGWVEPDLDF